MAEKIPEDETWEQSGARRARYDIDEGILVGGMTEHEIRTVFARYHGEYDEKSGYLNGYIEEALRNGGR